MKMHVKLSEKTFILTTFDNDDLSLFNTIDIRFILIVIAPHISLNTKSITNFQN